jgi:poly-gamma-glutamate capsule biosynthesis protein CapA/YwtB (metallophosphatase superfamily)
MNEINLLFSGDFAPLINPVNLQSNYFDDMEGIISKTDCHISNLECPLTTAEPAIEKTGPTLKAHPLAISLLKQARVDMVCLANNHIFDFGEAGLLETIQTCEQNGIDTLGIVNRPDKKKSWLIKEIKNKKIGFLNYCEHEFSVREEGEFGANGYDPIRCFYELSVLRPQVDYLLVIYHGGNEYYPLPSPGLKRIFHYLVDLGADAVIGHHIHVISGYEIYKGKSLVYSLGNFFFPFTNEPDFWFSGLLVKLIFGKSLKLDLIPIKINKSNNILQLITDEDKTNILKEIEKLSSTITSDKSLNNEWIQYTESISKGFLRLVFNLNKVHKLLLLTRVLNRFILPVKKIIRLRNLIVCQSHVEILKTILNPNKNK